MTGKLGGTAQSFKAACDQALVHIHELTQENRELAAINVALTAALDDLLTRCRPEVNGDYIVRSVVFERALAALQAARADGPDKTEGS